MPQDPMTVMHEQMCAAMNNWQALGNTMTENTIKMVSSMAESNPLMSMGKGSALFKQTWTTQQLDDANIYG